MTVLAGQETEGTEASAGGTAEIWKAYRCEVLKTGKVEALHVKLSAAFTGTIKLVVAEDAGASSAPGASLREVEASVTAQTSIEIAVTALEVTAGTFVWLSFWASAAPKLKLGSTGTARNATSKKPKFSEVAWGAEVKQGPIAIWATGTEGGETKTFTALVHGAGNVAVSANRVALMAANVHGAGQSTVQASKVAVMTAAVTGAGNPSASVSSVRSMTALVHGAGRATVTFSHTEGETRVLTALVHGGGRASVSYSSVRLATALVRGGGSPSTRFSSVRSFTGLVHGAGAVTVSFTGAGGTEAPCWIAIDNDTSLHIVVSNRKAVSMQVTNRKASRTTVANL